MSDPVLKSKALGLMYGLLAGEVLGSAVEGLEPQAEVRGNAEEGLTHDNKCRDVEKVVRS